MRILVVLAACAGVLALAGSAHAAQIASPTTFGAFTQDRAECVVLNGGTAALAVTVKILNESGGTVKTSTCGGSLPEGEFCSVSTAIDFGVGYACIATAPSTASLRGALVISEQLPDGFGSTYFLRIRSAPLR